MRTDIDGRMASAYCSSIVQCMEILDQLNQFFIGQSPAQVIIQLFAMGGWLVFFYLLLFAGAHLWADYKQDLVTHRWKWVLLAIDIPLENVQTPKAVEQLFAHIAGALNTPNIADKYVHGHKQQYFSFEIISIHGYIQFLIRTEESLRDLIEASVYAQYPEAEIVEVEDYTTEFPTQFPNDTYDVWGADFTLAENDAYPIRTYGEFEHTIVKDTILKDPMSALLESFTRLGQGEQMWLQIIVSPIGTHWKEKAIKKIKEIIGDSSHKSHGKKNPIADMVTDVPLQLLSGVGQQVFGGGEGGGKKSEKKEADAPNRMLYLTPGERKLIEAMENKITKIGFKTKIRAIYVARNEVFKASRGVHALIGAFHQFTIPSANSLVPSYTTKVSYFLKNSRTAYRKRLLMAAYKKRKMTAGKTPFVLNIEELATIWHFPMSHIKTPLLQKTTGKRSEPPASLPVEGRAPIQEEAPTEKSIRFG